LKGRCHKKIEILNCLQIYLEIESKLDRRALAQISKKSGFEKETPKGFQNLWGLNPTLHIINGIFARLKSYP